MSAQGCKKREASPPKKVLASLRGNCQDVTNGRRSRLQSQTELTWTLRCIYDGWARLG